MSVGMLTPFLCRQLRLSRTSLVDDEDVRPEPGGEETAAGEWTQREESRA